MATFTLPPGSEATAPPERRDGVRLLVARPGGLAHLRFPALPDQLEPGDLVVLNTSATLPAAVGNVHVSTRLDDGTWVVEVRRPDGPDASTASWPSSRVPARGPDRSRRAGESLELPGGVRLCLCAPYPDASSTRLWRAAPSPAVPLQPYLERYGRPIAYGHLTGRYPLADYQTVYGTQPGSAEMASAGRPFTAELVVRLVARGVTLAPVVLHAGVSSPEAHEPPLPERFAVPAATARLVNSARAAGGRVVAVGTTVVRALETAAAPAGEVRPANGWTNLVLGPDRPARTVTGLITGLHAPEASHLLLLEAVAGPDLVAHAYAAAVEHRYLWHEFGDSTLFLP